MRKRIHHRRWRRNNCKKCPIARHAERCARIGIALCVENKILGKSLTSCENALKGMQTEFANFRQQHQQTVEVFCKKLTDMRWRRNVYRFMFWTLAAIQIIGFVARIVLTYFFGK